MRTMLMAVASAALAAACGGTDFGTDPGGGTATLLVNGHIDYEEGAAHFDIDVKRAGADVTDAIVTVESNFGVVTLTPNGNGNGQYSGVQAGWGDGFIVHVTAGNDSLDGAIEAPDPVEISSPTPGLTFDPHTVDGGMVHVVWAGDHADEARVKTKDFEMTIAPDEGAYDIAATYFVEDTQDIEVRRTNRVNLAGGAPGSTLSAQYEDKVRVVVTNPF